MTGRFPPESPAQAATWDRVQVNALRFGLCERCASHLAWAHQSRTGGFDATPEPCGDCSALLAVLPVRRANGWRSVDGSAASVHSWPFQGQPGTRTPGGAVVQVDRAHSTGDGRDLRRSSTVDETLRERDV